MHLSVVFFPIHILLCSYLKFHALKMDNSIGSLFFSHILVMGPVNILVSSSLLFLQNNTIHLCLPLSIFYFCVDDFR